MASSHPLPLVICNGEIEYNPLVFLFFFLSFVTVYMIFGMYQILIQTPIGFPMFHPFKVARKEANMVIPRLGLI